MWGEKLYIVYGRMPRWLVNLWNNILKHGREDMNYKLKILICQECTWIRQAFLNFEKCQWFDVTWDGSKNAINLISGKKYTAVGGEVFSRNCEDSGEGTYSGEWTVEKFWGNVSHTPVGSENNSAPDSVSFYDWASHYVTSRASVTVARIYRLC